MQINLTFRISFQWGPPPRSGLPHLQARVAPWFWVHPRRPPAEIVPLVSFTPPPGEVRDCPPGQFHSTSRRSPPPQGYPFPTPCLVRPPPPGVKSRPVRIRLQRFLDLPNHSLQDPFKIISRLHSKGPRSRSKHSSLFPSVSVCGTTPSQSAIKTSLISLQGSKAAHLWAKHLVTLASIVVRMLWSAI